MFHDGKSIWSRVGLLAFAFTLGGLAPLLAGPMAAAGARAEAAWADDEKEPPSGHEGGTQRNSATSPARVELSAADEQRVRRIDQEIEDLRKQGRYADAAGRAEELVRIRRDAGQPPAWWERVDADLLVLHLRKYAFLIEEARKELAEADSMDTTIESLYASAQYVDALPIAQRQQGIRQRWLIAPSPDVASSLNTVGQVLTALGKNEQGEPLISEGLRMRRELFGNAHPQIAESLNNLGALLRNLGKLAESERCHREAWRIHERLELLHPLVIDNLGNWIACVSTRGDAAEANRICALASNIIPKVPVDDAAPNREQVLIGSAAVLANCAYSIPDAKTATPMYLEALQLLERATPKPHPGKAMILMSLASFSYWEEDWATAEKRYREAIRMQEGLYPDGHGELAFTWFNLASCLWNSGKTEEADAAYQQSLSLYEKLGWRDHTATIQVLLNYAKTLHAQREFTKAEELLIRALEVAERARPDVLGTERARALNGHTLQLTWVCMALAHLYVHGLNEPAKALDAMERGRSRAALDLMLRSEMPAGGVPSETTGPTGNSIAEALNVERTARAELGNAEQQLLETVDDGNGSPDDRQERLAKRRAAVAFARERLGRATTAVTSALEGSLPVARTASANEIQERLEPGELVLVFGSTNLHIFVVAVPPVGSGAIEGISLVYGYAEVKQFHELVERVRANMAHRSGTTGRDEVVRLTETLLPGRIRSSLQSARRIVVVPDGLLRHIPFDALTYPDQPAGKFVADEVEEIVYADSCSIYLNRKDAAKRLTPEPRPAALVLADPVLWRDGEERKYPPKGVLLAELAVDGNAAGAGLRRGDVILSYDGRDVTETADLSSLAGDDTGRDGEARAGKTAAVRYWRDGETRSANVQRGGLDAVLDDREASEALLEWSYTAQRGGDVEGARTASSSLDRWYSNLSALRGAPFEGNAIEKTITKSGGDATLLRRERASLDKLEAGVVGKRYVHLATHGFAGSVENSLDPCVVLAKPDDQSVADGAFLTLDRLVGHWRGKLSGCELVVLSACDTQKGIPVGETIMSLPLGFFQAGAPSVVASLWEVDDEATALLMKRFYENLLGQFVKSRPNGRRTYAASQRMSKADALHEAKRWLRTLNSQEVQRLRRELSPTNDALAQAPSSEESRGARVTALTDRDYSHPYYWAAFVLIGDGGPIN